MTIRLPKLYDLILNDKGNLGIITGFRHGFRPDLGTPIEVNGEFKTFSDGGFIGEGFMWSGPADITENGVLQHHLFLNNKGIWECVSRLGQCPLYKEWAKQNNREVK